MIGNLRHARVSERCCHEHITAQKMKVSIKDFFGKCDQIRRRLRIWSHLLKHGINSMVKEILNGKHVKYKTISSNNFQRCLREEIKKYHDYLKTSAKLLIPSPIQTEFYENFIISKILKEDQKHLWIQANKNYTNMNILLTHKLASRFMIIFVFLQQLLLEWGNNDQFSFILKHRFLVQNAN